MACFVFAKLWSLLGTLPNGSATKKKVVRLRPEEVVIKKNDFYQGFDENDFLEGAERAFDMILKAYHSGEKKTLQELVSADICKAFFQEKPNAIPSKIYLAQSEILSKKIEAGKAQVKVRFVSEQAFQDSVRETQDVWTFTRFVKTENPNWLLTDISVEQS